MRYYLLNVARRLRDRRLYQDLSAVGHRLIPGQRVYVEESEIVANRDTLYQLQSAGAIEIRRASDGVPVSAMAFGPQAPDAPVEAPVAPEPPAPSPPPPPPVAASLDEIFAADVEMKEEVLPKPAPELAVLPTPETTASETTASETTKPKKNKKYRDHG
ncbi:MAG: hypothetical protein GYA36_19875 [Veillonellaceae bacterium]|nr:hypothetical protein [Veillonellaceae bacterium]